MAKDRHPHDKSETGSRQELNGEGPTFVPVLSLFDESTMGNNGERRAMTMLR